jgi:hypothetical protein|tara:strand:+ start:5418 stop:5618 length:201 start_codon:yes stop_codon:yes gene_type:complete
MNLTEDKIRKMIREEIKHIIAHEYPSDVEAKEDSWAGGENLSHHIDYADLQSVNESLDYRAVFNRQ